MRRSNSSAFSMIEVAVAIGVMAILAGAVAPLAMKALNQAREQKTRDNMKTAFEAMFGSRDHRVANMRADFGFNPTAMLADLRMMTTRTPPTLRNYSPDAAIGGMPWGWNGPYWTGPTQTAAGTQGLPLDSWGRALRLQYTGGAFPTCRIQSAGVDGVFGGVNDLSYPTVAVPVNNYLSTVTVTVSRTSAAAVIPLPVTVAVTCRLNSTLQAPPMTPPTIFPFSLPKLETRSWTYQVTPGSVRIQVNTNDQIVDLLPGEFKSLGFQFD